MGENQYVLFIVLELTHTLLLVSHSKRELEVNILLFRCQWERGCVVITWLGRFFDSVTQTKKVGQRIEY